MTDKEKQAIEMFYNNPNEDESTRLWNNKQKKFMDFFAVEVSKNRLFLKEVCMSSGHVRRHFLEDVDLEPPKTLYDELLEEWDDMDKIGYDPELDNCSLRRLIEDHKSELESIIIE